MATASAPRPKITAANQTRPPRIGTRATTRRIAHPARKARNQELGRRRIDRPRIQPLAL
jgi:hypothetical protein